MLRRCIVLCAGVCLVSSLAARADVVGDDEPIPIPPPAPADPPPPPPPPEEPVTAAPPPWVAMQSTSIAAGLGLSWGRGTLAFEGEKYPFSVRGVSLGELGAARLLSEGDVHNLERVSDFAGTYVAVGAGAAAVRGGSAVAMRNEHGVVITLQSKLAGAQLALGAEGFRIELE